MSQDLSPELEKLAQLHADGSLSDAEFADAKAQLLQANGRRLSARVWMGAIGVGIVVVALVLVLGSRDDSDDSASGSAGALPATTTSGGVELTPANVCVAEVLPLVHLALNGDDVTQLLREVGLQTPEGQLLLQVYGDASQEMFSFGRDAATELIADQVRQGCDRAYGEGGGIESVTPPQPPLAGDGDLGEYIPTSPPTQDTSDDRLHAYDETKSIEQIATTLYDAWIAGDRDAALGIAPPQVVQDLFSSTPRDIDAGGSPKCASTEPDPENPFIANSCLLPGLFSIRIDGTPSLGWRIYDGAWGDV